MKPIYWNMFFFWKDNQVNEIGLVHVFIKNKKCLLLVELRSLLFTYRELSIKVLKKKF